MTTKRNTAQKKKYNKYTPEQIAEIRAIYERGETSIADLAKKYKIPNTTIEKWATKDKWEKGKNKELFEKTIAEQNIERLAKAGATPEKLAQRVADGSFQDRIALRELKTRAIELLSPHIEDPESLKTCVNEIIELFKDAGDTAGKCLGWVQEAHKLMGLHAPTKRELTGPNGAPLGSPLLVDIPEEELNQRIVEHVKRLGLIKG